MVTENDRVWCVEMLTHDIDDKTEQEVLFTPDGEETYSRNLCIARRS